MRIPTTHDDPATLLGALVALVGAIFGALVVFNVLDAEQAAALGAVASTALPLIVAALIRRYAWAPDTVRAALVVAEEGARRGDSDDTPPPPLTPIQRARARRHITHLRQTGQP